MFIRNTTILFVSLLAAVGCGGVDRDLGDGSEGGLFSGEDPSETASGEDEGTEPQDTSAPELLLACDLDIACDEAIALVRDEAHSYATSDLCALQALANGAPGLVQTVAVFPDAEAYQDHVIVGEGVVLRQAHGRSDGLGLWAKAVERCTLKSPKFFAGCLEAFDADCLAPEAWVERCEPLDSLTCPES